MMSLETYLTKQQQWLRVKTPGKNIEETKSKNFARTSAEQNKICQRDPFQASPPAQVDIEWPQASTRHLQAA